MWNKIVIYIVKIDVIILDIGNYTDQIFKCVYVSSFCTRYYVIVTFSFTFYFHYRNTCVRENLCTLRELNYTIAFLFLAQITHGKLVLVHTYNVSAVYYTDNGTDSHNCSIIMVSRFIGCTENSKFR